MPKDLKLDETKNDETVTVKLSDLKQIVREGITDQLKVAGYTIDDNMKAMVREVAEEVYNSDKANAVKSTKLAPREDPKGGFKSMSHFAAAVINFASSGTHTMSPELAEWDKICTERKGAGSTAQGAASGELGGFLIPTEFSSTVLIRARERSSIMQKATIIPMATNKIDIPFIKGFNESGGAVHGNISFIWPGETDDRSSGRNIELGQVELNLREASAMVYLNNSLIKFSPISIEPFVTTGLDDALDFTLSEKFIDGSGAGVPMGILNANCLVTVAAESEQTADTIEIENILQMFSRHYGTNKVWECNIDTMPQIATMVIAGGSSSTPVFMPAGGATDRLSDALLGRPINWNDHAKTVGDKGDVILADWSQYLVGQFQGDGGLEVAESIHLKFEYNQKALRFTFYIDGQPWWPSAFTPVNSVKTRSPFVVVAAR